jgi:hypothetical protein
MVQGQKEVSYIADAVHIKSTKNLLVLTPTAVKRYVQEICVKKLRNPPTDAWNCGSFPPRQMAGQSLHTNNFIETENACEVCINYRSNSQEII